MDTKSIIKILLTDGYYIISCNDDDCMLSDINILRDRLLVSSQPLLDSKLVFSNIKNNIENYNLSNYTDGDKKSDIEQINDILSTGMFNGVRASDDLILQFKSIKMDILNTSPKKHLKLTGDDIFQLFDIEYNRDRNLEKIFSKKI